MRFFFGNKPVLMTVEPQSQCWLGGRLAPSRNGAEWAQEIRQLPALQHVVRDGAQGIQKGLDQVNAERQERQEKAITDQLDQFHTLREGKRALRKTQAKAERAWKAAEEADRKVAERDRQGQSRCGYATAAARKWKQAEAALSQWEAEEAALENIRQALRPTTPQGELNTRSKAACAVEKELPTLQGEQWDKFKRAAQCKQTYTYLDRIQETVEALPVPREVKEAVASSEAARYHPELAQSEEAKSAVWRGLLLVWSVLISLAGAAGKQAVATLRQALRYSGRASSCVEGVNSVLRMQQSRHRKMTQELLDLKRLYWNLRKFRTGRRKKTSPYERLGLSLPSELSWWQLLQLPPEEVRALLKGQAAAGEPAAGEAPSRPSDLSALPAIP